MAAREAVENLFLCELHYNVSNEGMLVLLLFWNNSQPLLLIQNTTTKNFVFLVIL